MINYLMNNTVNKTELHQYYGEQHSKTTPHWRSWRDIIVLLLAIIGVGIFVCFLATRLHPLNALITILLRLLRNKEKQQQQKETETINKKGKKGQPSKDIPVFVSTTTQIPTVQQEYLRYTRASDSL